MDFSEKLQELRKQKGLTQEELAQILYVSRTAISKWESGRGYPSIDSLKAISKYFGITIDALLSCDEILNLAEENTRQKESRFLDLIYGFLDCSVGLCLVLPIFGQKTNGIIQSVSLLALAEVSRGLRIAYYVAITAIVLWGIVTLALQNLQHNVWMQNKYRVSIMLNIVGVLLFIISSQPYAAVLLFVFLTSKVLVFTKKQ